MAATYEQAILDIEHAETVAVIYDPDTEEKYDEAFNWQTGQTFAQMNYKVVAVRESYGMTEQEQQELYDYERRIVQDCFGLTDKDVLNG